MSQGKKLAAGVALYIIAIVCALAFAASMTGCASVQQAVQAYGTVAVTGAHAAADTVVQAQKIAICDLPYSAIVRNPDIIPAVRALCPSATGMFLPDPAPAAK